MKSHSYSQGILFLALTVTLLTACVSLQVKPPPEKLDAIERLLIVPVEPPPLLVHRGVELPEHPRPILVEHASSVGHGAMEISMVGDPRGYIGVFLVAGIFLLVEAAIGGPTTSEEEIVTLEELESSEKTWIPTVILSREAASQIQSTGSREVWVAPQFFKFSGIRDREATLTMEDWLGPIRRWYNLDISPFDYSRLNLRKGDAVLEMGLSNYEGFADRLVVQVHTKLVDPSTGDTLGRARAAAYPVVGDLKELFKDEARGFKDLFTSLGSELVADNLTYMGLLPE